jgi:hypothetical protein
MLINGRRDLMHHCETGQVPFFQAFDVPAWNDVVRNALRWYGRYLGPAR